jgi:NADPH:quinone reductase-like Zn-dependent oxidoreductase
MIRGLYNTNQELPLIPFSDGVGEVVEAGSEVERVDTGDRVSPIFARDWISGRPTREKLGSALGGPLDGPLTEFMCLPAASVVEVPEHLTDEEAATLPCAGLTAWNALAEQGDVTAGDRVATLGTGGVSSFGLLFGQMLGAEVAITSSSDEKLERAGELGADFCVNYEDEPEWGQPVKEWAGGVGVDHVLEVGGAETLEQSVRGVRIGGHISLIGVLSGHIEDFMVTPVLMRNVRIQGVIVGNREMFENMNRAIAAHEMRPVVDRVFGFDEVHEALQFMAEGRHFGKIAIRVDESSA